MTAISVLKAGEAYVVEDGHHRVAMGKQLGHDAMDAHVVEYRVKRPDEADGE